MHWHVRQSMTSDNAILKMHTYVGYSKVKGRRMHIECCTLWGWDILRIKAWGIFCNCFASGNDFCHKIFLWFGNFHRVIGFNRHDQSQGGIFSTWKPILLMPVDDVGDSTMSPTPSNIIPQHRRIFTVSGRAELGKCQMWLGFYPHEITNHGKACLRQQGRRRRPRVTTTYVEFLLSFVMVDVGWQPRRRKDRLARTNECQRQVPIIIGMRSPPTSFMSKRVRQWLTTSGWGDRLHSFCTVHPPRRS